jgi:hypothetical protein
VVASGVYSVALVLFLVSTIANGFHYLTNNFVFIFSLGYLFIRAVGSMEKLSKVTGSPPIVFRCSLVVHSIWNYRKKQILRLLPDF